MLALAAAAVAALAAAGCNNLEVCGSREEPLVASDGGVYRCTSAEDCPRSARVLVCTIDGSPEQECVVCEREAQRCVRVIPERCQ